jgi:hypothetical protein
MADELDMIPGWTEAYSYWKKWAIFNICMISSIYAFFIILGFLTYGSHSIWFLLWVVLLIPAPIIVLIFPFVEPFSSIRSGKGMVLNFFSIPSFEEERPSSIFENPPSLDPKRVRRIIGGLLNKHNFEFLVVERRIRDKYPIEIVIEIKSPAFSILIRKAINLKNPIRIMIGPINHSNKNEISVFIKELEDYISNS